MKTPIENMTRILLVVAAAAIALSSAVVWTRVAVAQVSPPKHTSIVFFVPKIPPGPTRAGSCWTNSIAAPRPGAWRCKIGNEIFDPCFVSPPNKGEVVCGANPATNKPGFVMKLTKPLPELGATARSGEASPWILELADGSICEPFTGTMPMAGGMPARWFCYNPAVPLGHRGRDRGVGTKVYYGQIWRLIRFAQADKMPPREGAKRVKGEHAIITKAWN